jgi:phage gp36-like protein
MSWRAITADDVHASMQKHEADLYESQLLVDGQSDPMDEVIAQVTLEARQAIRSCRDNGALHPTASFLPPGVIHHAVALIRHRLQTRVSDHYEPGEGRMAEYRTATQFFRDVASCKVAIERYGADEDDRSPAVMPQVSARPRRFTRSKQDGV